MHDKEKRKIVITIEGTDYDRLEAFKKAHEGCIYKYPNMTGANFRIETFADGFGRFKTVTCVCGASISLDGEYEQFSDLTPEKKPEPVFQVVPEDPETEELIRILLWIKKRPGMFFGTKRDLSMLTSFIAGYEKAAGMHNQAMGWEHIRQKLDQEYKQATSERAFTEEEQFCLYLDTLENVLQRDFPEYAKRFCETNEEPPMDRTIDRPGRRPTENQLFLFNAVRRELNKRANGRLSDDECAFIAANFAKDYDFDNSALWHKSPGSWAKILLEEL